MRKRHRGRDQRLTVSWNCRHQASGHDGAIVPSKDLALQSQALGISPSICQPH